ncbi:MAG TPA: phosphoenolpyruvate carboxylase [Xanthomonadales bacterium]|nr:phosphoenolpyruvate carboxylase [Xanthomonadales bacterium]
MNGLPPSEPLREIDLPATDDPLRDDVRRLGAVVGEILAEQVDPEFLAEVESIRVAAIRRREDAAPLTELSGHFAGIAVERAEWLVRAFATYFQAVNLAEQVHRIRRRRDYQRANASPQPGGLEAVLGHLRSQQVPAERLAELLPRLHIEPVFTAHPTEATRRVLLEKEREIARRLIEDIDGNLTPSERERMLERVRMALTTAWQTALTPPEKPTVRDELEQVGYYLIETLYRVLPAFYSQLQRALSDSYGTVDELPDVLSFGSWVGGDMDGNPNVGAATIADALASQRGQILTAYRRDLTKLASVLTQSLGVVGFDPAVLARIEHERQRLPDAAARLRPRQADMPYRNLLTLMSARLRASMRVDDDTGYATPDEFLADLRLIERSLCDHRGEHAGVFALRRLIRRVRCFGFHLATLDLRQESRQHDAALAALLADPDFPERPAAERSERLRAVIADPTVARPDAEAAAPVLAVFQTIARLLPRYGDRAFGPYIVSMSRTAADALAVLALARVAGCCADGRPVSLDIAPLFETVDDLAAAGDTLRSLFADPVYRAHLATRGGRQIVMLGYSDSAKDGGLIAARWALQRTQVELTALAAEAGIDIAFFHGRGGSISRGGGKTERAVIAAPRGSVNGHLRVTEQGEVIHRKYGLRAIALRNLEQTVGAVLRASLTPRPAEPREHRWRAIAAEIAEHSRTRYRDLVWSDPEFPSYFRAATPIDVIERLRIGSRPSKRGSAGGVESLRAIPWVFAWAQNRSTLTGWFGAGAGLSHGIERIGLEAMAEMARDWPFFAGLIDDLEMVLAKSDLAIFECYSRLAGPLHARFFPRIEAEHRTVRDAVLAIKGSDVLLSSDRRLRMSIRLRNPYVDPISLLQVDLLQRWRDADRPDNGLFHALVATVNGIAAGIQNTG